MINVNKIERAFRRWAIYRYAHWWRERPAFEPPQITIERLFMCQLYKCLLRQIKIYMWVGADQSGEYMLSHHRSGECRRHDKDGWSIIFGPNGFNEAGDTIGLHKEGEIYYHTYLGKKISSGTYLFTLPMGHPKALDLTVQFIKTLHPEWF